MAWKVQNKRCEGTVISGSLAPRQRRFVGGHEYGAKTGPILPYLSDFSYDTGTALNDGLNRLNRDASWPARGDLDPGPGGRAEALREVSPVSCHQHSTRTQTTEPIRQTARTRTFCAADD